MRYRHLASPLLVVLLVAACGTDGDSTFNEPDGGAAPSDTTPPPPPFVGTDPDGGPAGACASKVLCGLAATCCAAGQECVEGACVAGCTSGVRCGPTCCATGQVCLSQTCVAPGKACLDSFDCEETEFCEPTIGKCLPQPAQAGLCEYKPPVLPLAPKLEWSWTSSLIHPLYDQVINTPIVIDLDGDKIPEVIIVTSKGANDAESGFGQNNPAFLRVLDGKTGLEKWAANVDAYKDGTAGPDYRVNPRGTPAAADLDGDGTIEIVVPKKGGGLLAFRANGSFLWESRNVDNTTPYNVAFNSVTIAIADMDNDGKAEVVAGGMIFDHTGKLVNAAHLGHEKWGANDAAYGPVSIIADVDGNAASTQQHLVTGNRAVSKDGVPIWDVSATLTDGYPAIADLDKDGIPELVVVAQGSIRVQNALTGALIDSIVMPGVGRGGPPTIADFDNDGFMELASANGSKYNVFEYDTTTKKLSVKWSKDTQDGSSNVTGSSVFDFEGDGSAEVIYNDECYARVYRGTDGTELYKIPNSSGTIHEMPVLVDVDGDNNTEFVIVANDRNHLYAGVTCPTYAAEAATPRHGVFVYGDANDKWVRTRKLWNQHAYHITNISSDGKVPMVEARSFTTAENNDYRVSSQGKGVYNAPDLRVDLEVSTASCPTSIDLRARVRNAGALGVPAGVKVRFYLGTSATGQLLGEKATTKALLPGESEVLVWPYPAGQAAGTSFFVLVDGTTTPSGPVNECLTDNNSASAGGVRCPGVN